MSRVRMRWGWIEINYCQVALHGGGPARMDGLWHPGGWAGLIISHGGQDTD